MQFDEYGKSDMKVNSVVHVPAALAMVVIALSVTSGGHGINTDEMVELTHDEFRRVIVGNTLVREFSGMERHEFFSPDGTIDVQENVRTYTGRWTLAEPSRWMIGERNCVVLKVANIRTRCWIFLHDIGNDVYYVGTRKLSRYYYVGMKREEKYTFLTELRILNGRVL